jgi:hypothetical protein
MLAGICKKCREFRYGYLLYGRGPFICYQCAEEAAKKNPATTDTSNVNPGTRYFSYTFTTSNSTSTVAPTGDFHWDVTTGN